MLKCWQFHLHLCLHRYLFSWFFNCLVSYFHIQPLTHTLKKYSLITSVHTLIWVTLATHPLIQVYSHQKLTHTQSKQSSLLFKCIKCNIHTFFDFFKTHFALFFIESNLACIYRRPSLCFLSQFKKQKHGKKWLAIGPGVTSETWRVSADKLVEQNISFWRDSLVGTTAADPEMWQQPVNHWFM